MFLFSHRPVSISIYTFVKIHGLPPDFSSAGHILQQRLLVNDEMEIHPEEIRRLLIMGQFSRQKSKIFIMN